MKKWMQGSRWLCAAMLLCMELVAARAAEPSAEPLLRIEAGMHTAVLDRIATDRAGRYAITVSIDKTARVWDMSSGRLLRVLRPPTGEGNEGKLFAVAMTPDGDTVAVGGWTKGAGHQQHQVYLFDRATGRLRQRLINLPNIITNLAFSSDGRWLATVLGGRNGVRVWDWRSGGTALADSDVKDSSYGATWSSDHRLATTSLDGQIRLYRVEPGRLAKLAQAEAPGGQRPYSIAFSPDGSELAVGYDDSTRVDVLDGSGLTLKRSPSGSGMDNGNLSSVAWSADGHTLYAGGRWADHQGHMLIRRWPKAGRGAAVDVPTVGNTVMSLTTLPQRAGNDGGVLVGGADPAWGVLDAVGRWQLKQTSPVANLTGSRAGFRLSGDGREVQFGFEPGGNAPHRFTLTRRELTAGAAASLAPARTEGLPIEGWQNTVRPTLAGQPINLDTYEVSRSLALTPGNTNFVLGADFKLRRFDASGKELWQRPIPGPAWGVNIPTSGRLVVAAYGDGTIRWHRLSDGQELLAFFPHADRKRWVLWTPSGYYDASPGGEDLIGWHLNRGEDQAADFFPASRFRERFWRPDIIDQVLETLDEAQAIARADQQRGTRAQTASVAQVLPPVVELVSAPEVSTSQAQLTLHYRVRSAADAPVTRVRVRVNGQAQPEARNLEVQAVAGGERTVIISVPAQDSQVQLFVENRHGTSTAATVRVKWTGNAAAPAAIPATADTAGFQIRPKLYVLAIGVSAYQHRDVPRLSFAAKDARDFAAAMQRQKGRLYKDVEVKLVTEAEATRDNIADALDWLQRQVTQHDVGMLFFSGHGLNDPGMGYTFLPVNADPDKLKRTGVTMTDIRTTLNSMTGKVVAFLDTCHSGNVFGPATKAGFTDITGVISELVSAENGVIVFSSSTGRQLSLEDKAWNNGAFTKALVEGIDGKGDLQRTGRVTFKSLDDYITERVKELTNGRQSPVTQAPGGVNNFPLAVVAR